jgi:transcriptional regulator with XRE-family HTH domain
MNDPGSDWRKRGEPDPVDIHVGSRIKTRRILLGKSQEVVAARLGISFQQLQKYESGANRVSASRLFDLAHILMSPISYFFDEMPAELGSPGHPAESGEIPTPQLSSKATLDLVRDFHRIDSAQQRRVVLDLVKAMGRATHAVNPAPDVAEPILRRGRKAATETPKSVAAPAAAIVSPAPRQKRKVAAEAPKALPKTVSKPAAPQAKRRKAKK